MVGGQAVWHASVIDLNDLRLKPMLDELTRGFTQSDIELLKAVLKQNPGSEIEVLQDLMGYTYRHTPVPTRQFIEDPYYLGLQGQVFPKLLDDIEELFEGEYVEAVLTGAIGWGKACSLDTRVPTRHGWTTFGEVTVGDELFDEQGRLCKVTKKTEVMYDRPCFEVTFSDGTKLVADAEHQWLASEWSERANAARSGGELHERVVTTAEMAASLKHGRMNNWAVRVAEALDLPKQVLPVDPYVLGVWLGDGNSADGAFTCFDPEIVEEIRRRGYEVREQHASQGRYTIVGLKVQLRELGVLGNKHVPALYFRGSIDQRTDLLKGLMDTDGSIETCGRAEFVGVSKALVESVRELAASLGHKPVWSEGTARVDGKDCGAKYRVRFTPDTPVFCLTRKLERQRVAGKQGLRNKRRYVTAVVPVESVPVRCIEVDSPSHLFLVGDCFVPTHNSTFAEIAQCRMLYEISCLRDPQRVYGLMRGSVIVLLNVGVTRTNAEKIVFQGVKNKLHAAPYFVEKFPYGPWMNELRFPNNIWLFPATPSDSGVIGYNVFGGVMDEVNFMSIVEKSNSSRGGTGRFDQAETLHKSLIRRMKSRFMKKGKLPGILLQISSSRYPEDFTERRIKEAEDDPTVFVRRYSQWDTFPEDRWTGKRFWISLGDGTEQPRVIHGPEELKAAEDKGLPLLDVPEEFERDFEADIDAAIRDLAGRPTLTIRPYIRYRHKVAEALARGETELGLVHPFSKTESTLKDGGSFVLEKLAIPRLKQQIASGTLGDVELAAAKDELAFLKSKPRFVHADLSVTGDSTGIAMGYVRGYREVVRRNEAGEQYTTRMPIVVIEFMLRVNPPQNGEIEFADVRSLVLELRSYGYPIRSVTFDSFQSRDSMQAFKRVGIDSSHLSADTNLEVYAAYKDALYEDRFITYQYDKLFEETIRLEKNEKTGRVDHPANGSKDVADAVACVCYGCVKDGIRSPAPPPSYGDMSTPRQSSAVPTMGEVEPRVPEIVT